MAQWNGGAEAKVAFCASTGCGLPLRVDDASGSGSGHVDTMRATPPGAGAGDSAVDVGCTGDSRAVRAPELIDIAI